VDAEGRYRSHGKISYGIVGAYVFLLIVILLLYAGAVGQAYWWVPPLLVAIVAVMLARYLSTSYRIDEHELRAWRLFGGRRIRLEEVRRIEYSALRDLAPGGTFFGGWGWRGRMWSPMIGKFDALHTDPAFGILVSAGNVPIYISPQNPQNFARELSRRVRSYTGRLTVDVGDPLTGPPSPGA